MSPHPDHSAQPGVSLVLLPFGDKDRLRETIDALSQQNYPDWHYEIILMDDGSLGVSEEDWLEQPVRLIRCLGHGLSEIRRMGARAAKNQIVAFITIGEIPRTDWLEKIAEPFVDNSVLIVKGKYETQQGGILPRFKQMQHDDRCRSVALLERPDSLNASPAAYRVDAFLAVRARSEKAVVVQEDDRDDQDAMQPTGRFVFQESAIVIHRWPETLFGYLHASFREGVWKAVLFRRFPDLRKKLPYDGTIVLAINTVAVLLFGLGSYAKAWCVYPFAACLLSLLWLGSNRVIDLIGSQEADPPQPGTRTIGLYLRFFCDPECLKMLFLVFGGALASTAGTLTSFVSSCFPVRNKRKV